MKEEKILTRHPLGKSGKMIHRQKYEMIKVAIISVLRTTDDHHGHSKTIDSADVWWMIPSRADGASHKLLDAIQLVEARQNSTRSSALSIASVSVFAFR